MLYADEDGDDDYEVSKTRGEFGKTDGVETSASSFHTTEGLTVSVVRGSITDQKVCYS